VAHQTVAQSAALNKPPVEQQDAVPAARSPEQRSTRSKRLWPEKSQHRHVRSLTSQL
jgi:hypothetical protein